MSTHTQDGLGQSAKIYQFPVGGRRGLMGHRETSMTEKLAFHVSDAVSDALGGAWYHDEAIAEAAAPGKA